MQKTHEGKLADPADLRTQSSFLGVRLVLLLGLLSWFPKRFTIWIGQSCKGFEVPGIRRRGNRVGLQRPGTETPETGTLDINGMSCVSGRQHMTG